MYAMHCSEGAITEWLEPYMLDELTFKSYDDFKTQYLRLFGPASKALDADAIISKLHKNRNLPAAKLATSIDKVRFTLGYNEPALKDLFRDCLKPATIAAMVGQPKIPKDYAAFVEYCIEVEAELANSEKKHQRLKPSSNSGNFNGQSSSAPNHPAPIHNNPVPMDIDAATGKLKPSTREHCVKNNLCLYCGAKGHKAKDCPVLAERQKVGKGQARQ